MTNVKEQLTESLGWLGVFAIFCAYALLSFGYIQSDGLTYQSLNLVGGIGIMIDAFADKNYQPAVLNIIWALIAVIAMTKIIF